MKYNPRRNYLHPVLRPYSNDYPEGELETKLSIDPGTDYVTIAVDFRVNEPSIQEQIERGGAVCAAMLYCGPTLYREMIRAGKGSNRAETDVPTSMLRGEVLVHPAIFATTELAYQASTAHEEYRGLDIEIGQWNPMAVDRYWQFQVMPADKSTKGIFNLQMNNSLPDGEFDIECSPNEKYVSITANEQTRAKLKQLGAQEHDSLSTVYMSALTCALAEVKYMGDEETVHDDGWVHCIRNNMKRLNIDIGNDEDDGQHTLFRAAQQLLHRPFEPFMEIAIGRRHNGDEED